MGCTQPQAKPKSKLLESKPSEVQAAPAAPPVVKLSREEVEQKRRHIRENLDEGTYAPPKINIPRIQPIELD